MCEVQDLTKPTRQQYLPLMELAHKEDPDDAQICFWLGRDYMWAKQHERAIELLQRYLALPSSTWREERSEAMRYLARMQPDEKMAWLDKARMEAPHRREIWLDLAEEFHGQGGLAESVLGLHERDREDAPHRQLSRRRALLGVPAVRSRRDRRLASQRDGPRGGMGTQGARARSGQSAAQEQSRFFHQAARRGSGGSMSDLSTAPRARLFTAFGTVLYVDVASGELRHGPIESSPANAVFVADRERALQPRVG